MNAVFYNHLGLGDHFIHSSAIRKISNINLFEEVCILTKEKDLRVLNQLYSDIPNIKFIICNYHHEALNYVNNYNGEKYSCWWYDHQLDDEYQYEDIAYKALNLNPKVRYEWFKVNRNKIKEDEVYNEIIKDNQKYIFVADDNSRGYGFNESFVLDGRDYKIIKSDNYPQYTPLDLLKVIENSEEIHCMYSSFFFLCDQYSGIDNNKLPKIILHESYINKIGVKTIDNPPDEYRNLKKVLNKRNIKFI